MTALTEISYSLGAGLGYAAIFYPLTWLSMRKQFGLQKFGDSKRGLLASIVLLPVLNGMGIFGQADTPMGIMLAYLGPITTCALLIYFTRPTVSTADRPQKSRLAGIKKGWFRLWVVCSLCWVAFALNSNQAGHELRYAYRYYFDHVSLTTESAASYCGNPYNEAAASVMLVKKQMPERCIGEYKLPGPIWSWMAPVFLPPTLGVLLALLALWSTFSVMRWVWRGFKS